MIINHGSPNSSLRRNEKNINTFVKRKNIKYRYIGLYFFFILHDF